MKKIIILLVLSLFLCGCNNKNKISIDEEYIQNLVGDKEYVIVDVRTKEEYEKEHVINAINIPYDEINDELEISLNAIIFVYCQSGNRSKIAYDILKHLKYTVYDLGAFSEINLTKE